MARACHLSEQLAPLGGIRCFTSSLGSWKGVHVNGTVEGEEALSHDLLSRPQGYPGGRPRTARHTFTPGTALQLSTDSVTLGKSLALSELLRILSCPTPALRE